MRIKSVIAVFLASNMILSSEPIMVNASSTSVIVQNELAEIQEADTDIVDAVEFEDEMEKSDSTISEEEQQISEVPNNEEVIIEQTPVDETPTNGIEDEQKIEDEQNIENEQITEDTQSVEDYMSMEEDFSIDESIEIESEEIISNEADEEQKYENEIILMSEFEEDANDIGAGLTFTISRGTLTISGTGKMRDWVNSYYSDVKAPWLHKDVTNVIINAGVETIGDAAFENCSSIKSIVCKGDISKIGIGAFSGCTSLEKLEFDGTVTINKITDIKDCVELNTLILKKAAVFNDEAIMNMPKLKTITFPVGSTFGKKCFYGCEGLTNVTFMGSVDLSAAECFAFCPNLKTVTFNGTGNPNKITNNAFYYSNSISSITFKGATEIGDAIFVNLPDLKTLTFPVNTSFGVGAFGGCSGVTSIAFMGNVDLSAGYCFSGCSKLKTLSFNGRGPEKSIISNNAFSGGFNIATIVFKGPVDIGEQEFTMVQGIKSLTFGGDTNIDLASFNACEKLASVTFNGNAKLAPATFDQCINLSKLTFKKSAELDTDYNEIKYSPFHDCIKLASVTFGTGKTTLGDAALKGCQALKSVTFNGEALLSSGALSDCRLLSSVIFNGYADLDAESFLECNNAKLTKLELKKGAMIRTNASGNYAFQDSPITTIKFKSDSALGDGAFKDCDSLKTVTFGSDVDLGEYALSDCDKLTTVKCIGVADFARNALNGCPNLKTLSFAGEVRTYDDGACSNLPALTAVTFGNNTSLASESFQNCSKVSKVEFKKQANISTDSSANYAFKDSPLKSIIFGGNASLEDKAFYGCNTLTSVKFKREANLGKDVLSKCSMLKSISFGGKLSLLNDSPDVTGFCSDLPALTSVAFAGEASLPYGSFNNCNNPKFNKLAFGKAVTIDTYSSGSVHAFRDSAINTITFGGPAVLKYGAFQNNNSIKTLTFKGNASLGEGAFSKCAALTSVYFKGKTKSSYNLGVNSLRDCPKLKSLYFDSGELSVSGGACSILPSLVTITFEGNTTLLGECFNQCSNAKLTKLTFKRNAAFRPTTTNYPFVDSPIRTVSIAGNADLRANTFNDSNYITSIKLGASGKTVKISEALLRCGSLKTVSMTGTITVTDSLNICPQLTTVTIKYDAKKGESYSFAGDYFKLGCPKKIIINGKTVQYANL